ncbi:MAG: hypothetical protein ABWY93_03850 [Mycobacterium sp.]
MHVVAFAPANRAVLQDTGGVAAQGFPMTSAQVDVFPKQITLPLVLSVYTEAGSDYDPTLYIAATDPEGQRIGNLPCTWNWPDTANVPVKYRVFVHYLPFVANSAGVYNIGLYDSPDSADARQLFPLSLALANPLIAPHA